MLSITSERNSVQIDSQTVEIEEPMQSQGAGELPIAGEATSEEQDEQRRGELPNKYKYPIFAGYAGELYLQMILKLILPTALYRTWEAAVSFQAPGNACYVGVGKIAERIKPGVRTAQKDLQGLERRGLMRRYAARMQVKQKDGTARLCTVQIKDFGGLYDLAYEYHQWRNSEEYIEAEWENAEVIEQDEELWEKLMRFDNYRHILCCEKPGPKAQLTELEQLYQRHRQKREQEQHKNNEEQSQHNQNNGNSEDQERSANKYLPKQLDKGSSYRESKNPQGSIIQENSNSSPHSEEGVFGELEPETIRKAQQTDHIEQPAEIQKTNKVEEKQDIIREEKITSRDRYKSHYVETPRKEEILFETAKDAEEHDIEQIKHNPIAMATLAFDCYMQQEQKEQKYRQQQQRRYNQKKRKRRTPPEHLSRTIVQMVQQLGGNPQYQQSDITRMSKLYWACTQLYANFTNAWFLNQINEVFVRICKARKVNKRVPYFFTSLERHFGLSAQELAYLRSTEPLYVDGDLLAFVHDLHRRYQRSGSPLDYDRWVRQTYHLR